MTQATSKSVEAAPRLISFVLIGMLFLSTDLAAKPGAEAGILTCHSLPSTRVNLLLYSSVDTRCVFKTSQGEENYRGKTGIGLGVDFAWRPELEVIFAVLMASSDVAIGSHALAGFYGGASASASLGVSGGASATHSLCSSFGGRTQSTTASDPSPFGSGAECHFR